MATKTITKKAQAVDTTTAAPTTKATAAERLDQVLSLLGRETAKPVDSPEQVKWGKAQGLLGGGSVYVNRSNADVRSTPKQVADWSKAGLGTVRGPQGQYLRISF